MKNTILASVIALVSMTAQAESAKQSPVVDEAVSEETPVEVSEILYSCQSEPTGKWNYSYSIEVSEDQVGVYQSSMIARYAAIELEIARAPMGSALPEGEAKFSCTYEAENEIQYRATVSVFDDSVVVFQSSTVGRYAPLKFDIISAK